MRISTNDSWGGMGPLAFHHFGKICRSVRGRGEGITWDHLRDARALALEVTSQDPDIELIDRVAGKLGVDSGEFFQVETG